MTTLEKFTKRIEKLNQDLNEFAKRTDEDSALLYENSLTTYRIKDVTIQEEPGKGLTFRLEYEYDYDDGQGFHHEVEKLMLPEEVDDYIKFWREGLRRAKRYWEMDAVELDHLQDKALKGEEVEQ